MTRQLIERSRSWFLSTGMAVLGLAAVTAPAAAQSGQGEGVPIVLYPEPPLPGDPIDVPTPPRALQYRVTEHRVPAIPQGTGGNPQPNDPPCVPVPHNAAPITAPEDFRFFKSVVADPAGSSNSTTAEPSVSINRDTAFMTGNWWAGRSEDSGHTWTHVNPSTNFTSLDGGFCCDQRTIYVASHDITIWLLQYSYSAAPGGNGSYRIAVARGRTNLRNNVWASYIFSNDNLGLIRNNTWFDFPDIGYTGNRLWISANVYDGDGVNYFNTFALCLDLTGLRDGTATNGIYFLRSGGAGNLGGHSYRFTQNATAGTMYFAAHLSTTSLRIYSVVDGSNSIAWSDKTVAAWNSGTCVAPGPDGRDWAGFGAATNDRVQTGYYKTGEIGFAWGSAQGASRAFPFTRIARFNSASPHNLIAEHDLWNSTLAYLYPAFSTNARGDIGAVTAFGGGATFYPSAAAYIIDSYDPWPPAQVTYPALGTHGPSGNRWGDYYSVQRHPIGTNTFIGSGANQNGGTGGANNQPRFMWFGREEVEPTWVPLNVNSTPITGIPITVDETDRLGAKNGTTNFVRSYAPRQAYTLTAPATHVSGGTYRFERWSINGGLQPVGQLTVAVDDILTAVDTAEAQYRLQRTLAVQSTNPASGVAITASIADVNGAQNGTTSFSRIYKDGYTVTLTAPAAVGANPFKRWRVNGANQPLGQVSVAILMGATTTAIADYYIHTAGSFTAYSAGCAGSNGVDVQTATGTPEIGQNATYRLAGGRPLNSAILVLGFSNTSWFGVPLPLPLTPSAPGCFLGVSVDVTFSTTTNASGVATFVVPIVNDITVIGGHFYTQYWCIDLGANALNLTFSNGIDTLMGGNR